MTLTQITNQKIKEAIETFHFYLNEGIKLENAKKMVLKNTVLNDVIEYINNYEVA